MAKPHTPRLGRPILTVFTLAFALVIPAVPLAAQTYTFKIIDDSNAQPLFNVGNNVYTIAQGINDSGLVVGFYSAPEDTYYGFYGSDSNSLSTLGFPSGCSSFCGLVPDDINDLGEIVGEWDDGEGYTHGFYLMPPYGGHNPIPFDYPNAALTIAQAVNKTGLIVGGWQDGEGNTHGFKYANQSFSQFDFSVCPATWLNGVNDGGDVVGYCPTGTTQYDSVGWELTAHGQLTEIAFPGAVSTRPYAVNNSDEIVGTYNIYTGGTPEFETHCFLLANGTYNAIPDPPESAGGAICYGINNIGQIAGYYEDAEGVGHGFVASGPVLLDPVPTSTDPVGLLNGSAVGNTNWLQATPGGGAPSYGFNGRVVYGIAADGVSEIVIRVPAKNVGDQFVFTLLNDQNEASTNSQFDGALGNPGDTTFTQNQVTVSAINLTAADDSQSPYAFAVYQAPIDFVRQNADGSYFMGTQHFFASASGYSPPCGGAWPPCVETVGYTNPGPRTDDQLASRGVTIQVQDVTNNTTFSMPVEILRPPVVMIHGIWGHASTWDNFYPLIQLFGVADARFYVARVSYDDPIGVLITGSSPSYLTTFGAETNSLGFSYNAPYVLSRIQYWIGNFKQANDPLGIPVAAVQTDIVAHSMGGDITRTIASESNFLSPNTFGQGNIHKVITIDTPHLGTILAADLLGSGEGCMQKTLALGGDYTFDRISLLGSLPVSGAVHDLSPGSDALLDVAFPGSHPLPTALIAGVYSNYASLDLSATAAAIRFTCGTVFGDPLAQDLTSTKWPAIFAPDQSDVIVPVNSQFDGLGSGAGFTESGFGGFIHSSALEQLGFSGSSVLDSGVVPNLVITLLNTMVTEPAFNPLNP